MALVIDTTGQVRFALIVVLIFLVVGLILMYFVDPMKGKIDSDKYTDVAALAEEVEFVAASLVHRESNRKLKNQDSSDSDSKASNATPDRSLDASEDEVAGSSSD
jgi:hypothetical protein